jgi:trehalose 6-phosphate phosphatase
MKIIDPDFNIDHFWSLLGKASSPVLILDYDGTLAPFQTDPMRAVPYPDIPPLLKKLMHQSRTRVIIVSGRPAEQVLELLGLEKAPEVWGCHGAERLNANGKYHALDLTHDTVRALGDARARMEQANFGGRIEIKPFSIAVHWRGLDGKNAESVAAKTKDILKEFTGKTGLSLHGFDGGLELRPNHITKAHAVETILAETGPSFVGAYWGDDHTDEDAFAALADRGLSVLVRTEFRPTRAQIWLQPPEDLITFLCTWLDIATP